MALAKRIAPDFESTDDPEGFPEDWIATVLRTFKVSAFALIEEPESQAPGLFRPATPDTIDEAGDIPVEEPVRGNPIVEKPASPVNTHLMPAEKKACQENTIAKTVKYVQEHNVQLQRQLKAISVERDAERETYKETLDKENDMILMLEGLGAAHEEATQRDKKRCAEAERERDDAVQEMEGRASGVGINGVTTPENLATAGRFLERLRLRRICGG